MSLRTGKEENTSTGDSIPSNKNSDEFPLRSPAARSALQFSPFTDLENDATDCRNRGRFRRVMTEVSGVNTPAALTAQRELSQTTSCDSNHDSMRTVPSLPSGQSVHSSIRSLPRGASTTAVDLKTCSVVSGREDNVLGKNNGSAHVSSKSHVTTISSRKDSEPAETISKEGKDAGLNGHQDSSVTTQRAFNIESSSDSNRSEKKKKAGAEVHSPKRVTGFDSFEKEETEQQRTPSKKESLKAFLSLKKSDHDRVPARKGSLLGLLRKTSKTLKGSTFNVGKSGEDEVQRNQISKCEENDNITLKVDKLDITNMNRRFSSEWAKDRCVEEKSAAPLPVVGSASGCSSPPCHTYERFSYTTASNCTTTNAGVQLVRNELNIGRTDELAKHTLNIEKYLNRLVSQ